MPELPEVETMRRGVLGTLGGRILQFCRLPCPRKPINIAPQAPHLEDRTAGRQITQIDRIGKRVVLRLDSQDALVFEPRMTGLLLVGPSPDPLYLRVRIDLEDATEACIWFWDRRGLGHVRLLSPAEQQAAFAAERIGPDALTVTAEKFRERLGSSRRAVKVALLDQRAVAGIGNLYAAELLNLAGIHPQARCDLLTSKQWGAIADATRAVLEEAILHEGSTLSDGTYRNALNQDGGYQNHHRVYNRAGSPCPRCGGTIRRIVQAQRSTFFCPGCQKRR